MAGIFGFFDYTKPGKGVSPDEPPKRAPIRYFILLGRNLTRFITLNLIYFICVLPMTLAFHVLFFDPVVNYMSVTEGGQPVTGSLLVALFSFVLSWPPWLLIASLLLSAALQGPVTCGLTYCLRNAVREEHFWRSDLWNRAVSNMRQGFALSALDAVVLYTGFFNLSLLMTSMSELSGPMQVIVSISAAVTMLYLAVRNTIYTMAVTFDLSLPQLIRNAVIMTVVGLPRHMLTGLLQMLIMVLVVFVSSAVELIVLPLLGFVLMGYTSVFVTYPLIDKYMLQPQLKAEAEADSDRHINPESKS